MCVYLYVCLCMCYLLCMCLCVCACAYARARACVSFSICVPDCVPLQDTNKSGFLDIDEIVQLLRRQLSREPSQLEAKAMLMLFDTNEV